MALLCASWSAIPAKKLIAEVAGVVSQSNYDGSSTKFCSKLSAIVSKSTWHRTGSVVWFKNGWIALGSASWSVIGIMSCLASSYNYFLCCSTICDVSGSGCDATSLLLLDELPVYWSSKLIWGILCGPNMYLGVLSTKVCLHFQSLTLTIEWLSLP